MALLCQYLVFKGFTISGAYRKYMEDINGEYQGPFRRCRRRPRRLLISFVCLFNTTHKAEQILYFIKSIKTFIQKDTNSRSESCFDPDTFFLKLVRSLRTALLSESRAVPHSSARAHGSLI